MRGQFLKVPVGLKSVRERLCVDKVKHPQAYAYAYPRARGGGYLRRRTSTAIRAAAHSLRRYDGARTSARATAE